MAFDHNRPEPLAAHIHFRATAAEKQWLRENARTAAITVSRFVRYRSLGRPVVANADAAMIRELRRIGGLLKHIHVQSQGAYSKQTAEALSAVTAYITRLGQSQVPMRRSRQSQVPHDGRRQ